MKLLLAVLLAVTFLVGKANAVTITNPGFETGDLTGWLSIGDALVVGSSFGDIPAQGTFQALITNEPSGGPGTVLNPLNLVSYSGTNATTNSLAMDAFFNLPLGSWSSTGLCTNCQCCFESSGIKQSFTTAYAGTLSFSWNYLTDEGGYAEPVVFVLDGTIYPLVPVPTNIVFSSPSLFLREYGYRETSINMTAGQHTLGFGVAELGDPTIATGVLIDNISFNPVPEPPSLFLLFLSFGVLLVIKKAASPA